MHTDPLGIWAHRPSEPLRARAPGPLSGLTFSAKDLYGIPGWPLRAGTQAPLPNVGESLLVRQLLERGADLIGSTQLHEVALGIIGFNAFGGTRNPLDPARIAGGSSGGAAASVALGEVDFALGTDTGGSIRVPASFCGVVGFKPTFGLYSTEGVLPLSQTCDHAGPLARTVGVIARVHEAVTGQAASTASWQGQRVGLWNVPHWTTPTTWAQVVGFAERLRTQGASVELFEFPDVLDVYTPIVLAEGARVHADALAGDEPGFAPRTLELLRRGQTLTHDEVRAAHQQRASLRGHLDALFQAYDVLLAPAVPDVAPLIDQEQLTLGNLTVPVRQAVLRLTAPWSLLGTPVLALPQSQGQLSTGVQLIMPWGADAALLSLGLACEAGA
ncbi:amidase [Deinococcus peraridilitoris]|uniref:Amidase, Asp-tRNAAsn/Glu-tRNAGln amidotransferase A subunit n=1 Tax=Deinococcus peraridilitoris (strain DSM 19664 / LMG 22246 / CIP 109416 / KR-200) TaxID=937777 RepID=K9ZXT1_DEIPD|nr:amidase [Deinococcus peraridilitoris]AFZ66004.1 amidase, Asp-tRNAAsn/Glu-tRNAGln amidotransferase A subunit [Deinococcus peraridilitoris DSM 19664]